MVPISSYKIMINFGTTVKSKDGRSGKVIEVVLFRRDDSIGYGLKDQHGKIFYVPVSDIK